MKIKMVIKKKDYISNLLENDYQYLKVSQIDIDFFAQHLLDAYQGTTDDEGEDLEDSMSFLNDIYQHRYGEFLDDYSLAIMNKDTMISGIIYAMEDNLPYIVTVFTNPLYKGKGYAKTLIRYTLNQIFSTTAYEKVVLYVTSDNPAIHLYERIGFNALKED